MQRIFIVGCPRSGTTLVQAMLARHPAALSLPETAFFEHLYGNVEWRWGDSAARPRRRLRQRLGLAHQQGRAALGALRGQLPHDGSRLTHWPLRTASCVRRFIGMLDARARADGCTAWIEKTPSHLLYIPEIERYVPEARFVHVIRQGEDVLASIADASMRYAEMGIFSGGTAKWLLRWNHATRIHRAHASRPNHHLVFLDDLIRDPQGEWRKLCAFLDFDPAVELADGIGKAITDLSEEPWKNDAVSGQPSRPRRKAEKLFGPRAREWLQQKLVPYEELRRSCVRGG